MAMTESNMTISQKEYWEREELHNKRKPDHPVIQSFIRSRIREIQKYLTIDENTTLLEVGAGNGVFSYYFDKLCKITATDYSEVMVEINPVKNKKVMDATDLQFPDNSFDVVFECCMLHHICSRQALDKSISEMMRVSSKHVVFIEPNRNNPLTYLFSLMVKEERPALDFSLNYLKDIITANGLKITDAFSYGVIAPNALPSFMLPLFSIFDKKLPFGGLDNIAICKK